MNPGQNVGIGKDDTLYALAEGRVKLVWYKGKHCVSIIPEAIETVN